MLQGHVKTSFKVQMHLVFVMVITMDTITIYHTIASTHSSKMLERWVNCAHNYLLLSLCKCIDIADSS